MEVSLIVERTKAIVVVLAIGFASIGGVILLLPRTTLEQHDPIVIERNEDFVSQGWSGTGTVDDPYVISGLSIESSDTCISIDSTSVHFTIQDCYISSTDPFYTVHFSNIENGVFTNNDVEDSSGHGICLDYCDDVSITSNSIKSNGLHGIYLHNSVNCRISYNNIDGNDGSGILLTYVSDCQILSNTIVNNGEWGLYFDSSNGNTESGNTFQDNDLGSIGYQNC